MSLKTRVARLEIEHGVGDTEVSLEETLRWLDKPPTGPNEERAYTDFCRRWPQSTLGKMLSKFDRPWTDGP